MWWVVARAQSSLQAHCWKLKIQAADICTALRDMVSLKEVLGHEHVLFQAECNRLDLNSASFTFTLMELRVIGGRILDVIDPSRACIDPSTVPLMLSGPSWIPALVRRPSYSYTDGSSISCDELHFISEVSGVPWMGTRTLATTLYQRLGQVLTCMQHLFINIHRPLAVFTSQVERVVVKAQIYELQAGDDITGQMHREGIDTDLIEAVGLYYPLVDEALTGGELEITTVMRGACGSMFPVSKPVVIAAGTAVIRQSRDLSPHVVSAL